jgi:hypothetical protein
LVYWPAKLKRGFRFSQIFSLLLLCACGGGGGGGNAGTNPNVAQFWLIPSDQVVDGGPGQDGIPSIDAPEFGPIASNTDVGDDELVIAVLAGSEVKVYPHAIMDWHEVLNDTTVAANDPFALSYCPLTGSAVAWAVDSTLADTSFGVSGRLYNSNLILYDRQSSSLWVQMMQLAVNGSRIGEEPSNLRIVETTKATIRSMYPAAMMLTRNTGFTRNYDEYPYGSYRADPGLLFPVETTDNRLHPKTRVLGVKINSQVKVYQVDGFGPTTQVVLDQLGGRSVVVAGNSDRNFAVAFSRELDDGTVLNLAAYTDSDPANILQDDEGNVWNVWGTAVSGPREDAQLEVITAYVAYWFAFAAFYPQVEIHFGPT